MATIRVNKTKNYTVMSNNHLRDTNLSLKAKGLLSIMLSLSDDWAYSIEGLVEICKESTTSIKAALNELKENGYLVITKLMPGETKSGRIEYEYNIYENPKEKQETKKQELENQPLENQPQLNTNKRNTKEKKDISKDISKEKKKFIPPTLEEIQEYCIKRNNGINPEQFLSHYESNGWMVGRTQMKDWQAAIRYWETNSRRSNVKPMQDIGPVYDTSNNPTYSIDNLEELIKEGSY